MRARIEAALPRLIEIRHDLHRHPEVCYEEVRTAGVVRQELDRLGVRHTDGLAGGTGTVAFVPATRPGGKCIALRADIDALPIHEETGLPYASETTGKMHACGHDGHTSILLGAAAVLSQTEDRPNDVLLLFQPAEEGGGGADRMCKDGALEGAGLGPKADMIFGLHGWPGLELGELATRTGAMMASSDVFHVTIRGKGGHAAFPHTGIDPIVIASHVVVALQTIVSRNTNPLDSAVVTVGIIQAGTASNIIPDECHLTATLRTLNDETRAAAKARIQSIVSEIPKGFGGSGHVLFDGDAYPVTVNHPDAVARWRTIIPEAMSEDLYPVMGAEDFSFYGHHIPACFFALGLKPREMEVYPNLHAPNFNFNDDALPIGVDAMCRLALSCE